MPKKCWVFLFLGFLVFSLLDVSVVLGQERTREGKDQITLQERGVGHFERGFYDFLPKGRRTEAEREFQFAIQALKQVLDVEPNRVDTHRFLAKIYTVQKRFLLSADHYRKLTDINPLDLDSYVLAATAFAEANRLEESKAELEKAKQMTTDPRILSLLEGYLKKVAEAEKIRGADRSGADNETAEKNGL